MSISVPQNESAGLSRASSGWPTVELGEVCHVQLGKMLSPKSKTGTRPVPYLRNENVQWNRFDLKDVSWMDFSEREEEKFRLQRGDLLVCEGGEPGRAAVWEGQIERCCYQKALHRIRPRDERLFPPFLMYRLWMSAMDGEFAGSQTQTTISHVPREKLVRLRLPMPPFTEQQRIAAGLTRTLAGVAAVRSMAEERIATAEALPAAYLREVFEGPEASRWQTVPLAEVCRPVEGQVDPRDPEYRGLPHINGETIESGSGRLLGIRSAEEDGLISGKYLFEPGMVLYSKLRPYLRKVAIAPIRGLCSADMYPLIFDEQRVDSIFAMFSLLAEPFTTYAVGESQRARMPKLNREQLFSWQMPVPALEDQRQLAAQLSACLHGAESLVARCREELAAIEAIPAAALRAAFSEEL